MPVAATPPAWVDWGGGDGRGRKRGIDFAGRAGTVVMCAEGDVSGAEGTMEVERRRRRREELENLFDNFTGKRMGRRTIFYG